ncbi:N-acetyltryptophan 6-hydroxylase ivoC [Fusarium oxysporum f. sp. albedinis]|nr:N-acetyltryptophan 6-hydroxylase ivoC [Fusarium oxysporum f. sp. albedinis]
MGIMIEPEKSAPSNEGLAAYSVIKFSSESIFHPVPEIKSLETAQMTVFLDSQSSQDDEMTRQRVKQIFGDSQVGFSLPALYWFQQRSLRFGLEDLINISLKLEQYGRLMVAWREQFILHHGLFGARNRCNWHCWCVLTAIANSLQVWRINYSPAPSLIPFV